VSLSDVTADGRPGGRGGRARVSDATLLMLLWWLFNKHVTRWTGSTAVERLTWRLVSVNRTFHTQLRRITRSTHSTHLLFPSSLSSHSQRLIASNAVLFTADLTNTDRDLLQKNILSFLLPSKFHGDTTTTLQFCDTLRDKIKTTLLCKKPAVLHTL